MPQVSFSASICGISYRSDTGRESDFRSVGSYNANVGFKRAREARADLGLALSGPVPDLLETVERLAPVAVLHLAQGIAGAFIDGAILVNGTQPPQRQRFTLAHELGHLRMSHEPVVDTPADLTGGHGSSDEEVQANSFASEFLMPRQAICERFAGEQITLETVAEICCEFGVSAKAALIRLRTAGLVDHRVYDRLDREIEDKLVLRLIRHLDCEPLQDSLSDLPLPRLPERPNALVSHLAGTITLEQLAYATGTSPAALADALRRQGFSS